MRGAVNTLTVLLLTPIMMVLKPIFVLLFVMPDVIKARKAGEKVPVFTVFLFILLTPLLVLHTAFHILLDGGLPEYTTREILQQFIAIGD
ncbi:MAG: hypothetical protein A3I38_03450 [Candidatus Wildermuthbacteria bacterium RIFCSPLOWO2_02_FULL_47_10]|uniref:Uncharacterized protein n=1 Tax=Candidatus Wildermuthbacteria bacterium RIFCSPHIGHO2_02_FULL_47_17 TaxID=1802452 RepID=A0A1G2R3J9_9BACT|nr:MAG: hypothetical protein UY15_C0021G0007 [Parcubacteria group bacterium GW2011_GWA2_47_9]OHA67406.1 MAG: hypothetical protein A3D59_01420 [Candidatus Wildermuthbacteria bacterium RIFCSPHIGHO2_02_FULL_47_17]OHA75554.1 MAG: hypothetical protein A3I38_03450 [Candidatus Wildermuthbacteria bacterium RIFCSPLOWO2_02_FULL_47_10]